MTITLRHALCSLTAAILLAAIAGAQAPPPAITIDFTVTSPDGRPVVGLSPSDVAIKIAGRERPVRSLELVTIGESANPAEAAAPSALPAPFGVTAAAAPASGRNVLLLVDEGTLFGLEGILKDSVGKLLGSLGPRDRVGLVSTRENGTSLPLTTRHETVREAVDAMVLGRGNAAVCIGALMNQVLFLAQTLPPGRASTLAVISRGAGSGPGAARGNPASGAGNCLYRTEQLRPVAETIAAAQINYHVFHLGPSGLSPSLDNFAGATGGESGILSWSNGGALERVVQAVRQYYRATIDADAASREGVHRTELRVQRPGVKVRAPSHLSLAPTRAVGVDAASLLRGDATRADFPIRVGAFPSRNDGALPVKLVVVIEPVLPGTKLAEAMLSVTSSGGEVAGQWTARPGDLARVPVIAAVPVAGGSYRLRVAAVDERGRGGTAEYELDGSLAGSGAIRMSAIVLGTTAAGGFSPRLLFGAEPAASVYMEIYGAPASAAISAVFELASSADGAPVASIPGQVAPAAAGHMVTASIPLGPLPAGDTLVRARVTVDGTPAGSAVRTLRKSSR
ncbi:MAG TPA: hypothetical protein VJ813_12825 [Vicinamibacterales bacterium]|nr:hypothetical protein [Vicinamibacterales bacterium]